MVRFTHKSLIYMAVCLALIRFKRSFFTLVAKHFEIVFKSKFNNEICLQLEIYLLSLLEFSQVLIIACRCEAQRCFTDVLIFSTIS